MKNIFFLFLLVSMLGCQKSDLSITVKSEIFQCCNLWGDTAGSTDTAEILPAFLAEKNIEFAEMKIVNNGLIVLCTQCCKCPMGKTVEFKADAENLPELLDLGFEEK